MADYDVAIPDVHASCCVSPVLGNPATIYKPGIIEIAQKNPPAYQWGFIAGNNAILETDTPAYLIYTSTLAL
jgi:hypothetical protein